MMGDFGKLVPGTNGLAQNATPKFGLNGVFSYNPERFYEAYLHKLGVFYGSSHEQFVPSKSLSLESVGCGVVSRYISYCGARTGHLKDGVIKKVASFGGAALIGFISWGTCNFAEGLYGWSNGNLILAILNIYGKLADEVAERTGRNERGCILNNKKDCLNNFTIFVRVNAAGEGVYRCGTWNFFTIKSRKEFGDMFGEGSPQERMSLKKVVKSMKNDGYFRNPAIAPAIVAPKG
jgi:hypothetical protein